MRNYKLIISVIFALSIHAFGMESKKLQLSDMPLDILNHIASFLIFKDRESDAEFIKRASQGKKDPGDAFFNYAREIELPVNISNLGLVYTWTVDNSKVLAIHQRAEPGSLYYATSKATFF